MRIMPGRVKANHHIKFSPDGRFLACGGNSRGVALWNLETNEKPATILERGHGTLAMCFDSNTDRLIVAFVARGVFVWGPTPGREYQFASWGNDGFIHGMAVAPEGKTVVVSGYRDSDFTLTKHLLDSDTPGDEILATVGNPWAGEFVFRPGGEELFGYGSVSYPRCFVAVDADELSRYMSYPIELEPSESVVGWALSPDGSRVAYTTRTRLRVLELATRIEVEFRERGFGRAIAFHPGGELLAVGWEEGVRLLDSRTFAEVRSLSWNKGRIRSLAFAPDGMTAASAGERGWVTLWDVDL
jgi:WD40 repeat protein